jgi:hypothetical protein
MISSWIDIFEKNELNVSISKLQIDKEALQLPDCRGRSAVAGGIYLCHRIPAPA